MAVAAANKIVRGDDLTTVAQEIDKHFQRKVNGKGLSTNDYTTDEKTKLAGIESGAQKNVKPDWNAASGSAAEILNKPTIPAAVQPATTAPKMDGTAAVGSSAKYAKEDHVHPSDTNKLDVNNPVAVGKLTIESVTQAVVDGIPHPERKMEFNYSMDSNDLLTYKIFNFSSGKYRSELTFKKNWFATGESPIELFIPCPDGNSGTLALTSDITSAISNKADKSTTLAGYGITNAYTKTEVDTAISNALKGGYTVVATLPTASADTMGKIYLVPMTDTEDDNVKEEYITYLDGSAYKWEKLGTTQFDNSDYEERLTASEITTLLNL